MQFTVTGGSAAFGAARTVSVVTGADGNAVSPLLRAGAVAGPVAVVARVSSCRQGLMCLTDRPAAEVTFALTVTAKPAVLPDGDDGADTGGETDPTDPTDPADRADRAAPLAVTGAESAALAQLAVLLVLGGLVVLRLSRRRVARG